VRATPRPMIPTMMVEARRRVTMKSIMSGGEGGEA
jgi:hypothetical protein